MSRCIKELVTEDIYNTLANVTQLAGYENNAEAAREHPRGTIWKDRKVLVIDNGDTPIQDSPGTKDDYTASYTLVLDAANADALDGSAPIPDAEKARFVADLRKALMQDYGRNGWAINTTIGTDATTNTESGQEKLLELTVHYRTALDDPYSL